MVPIIPEAGCDCKIVEYVGIKKIIDFPSCEHAFEKMLVR